MSDIPVIIYPMYAVRDIKADGFGMVQLYVNEQTAKRDFDYRLHNDHSMGFSPADYDLYKIGEMNGRTGQVTGLEIPEFIVNGGQLF